MSKWIQTFVGATALGLAFTAAAQTAPDHTQHHPAPASAPVPEAAPAAAQPTPAAPQMQQRMQEHMASMQTLRNQLAAAKTPAEREALMADHMKAMQDCMDMMKGMSGMSGMGIGKAPAGAAPMDPAQRMQAMEMRMDMMQNMMQMMMDRMAPAPTAK